MNYTQEQLGEILDNVFTLESKNFKITNTYYVGGSLAVDIKKENDVQVLMFNLNEMVSDFVTGAKILLSIDNVRKVFAIYRKHRGETEYYKNNVNTSVMRYFKSCED